MHRAIENLAVRVEAQEILLRIILAEAAYMAPAIAAAIEYSMLWSPGSSSPDAQRVDAMVRSRVLELLDFAKAQAAAQTGLKPF